jgi:spore coat protein CotH
MTAIGGKYEFKLNWKINNLKIIINTLLINNNVEMFSVSGLILVAIQIEPKETKIIYTDLSGQDFL